MEKTQSCCDKLRPIFMQTIQQILETKLRDAVGDSGGVLVTVQSAQDTRFGDYQSNVAMQLAKPRRANPRALAQEIIAKLDVADLCETPEIAGAGFINFRLKPSTLIAHFTALACDERLGVPTVPSRRLVIDFSSPNVAKPMHVGHIRSTFLGDALARIGRFLGHTVVSDNHIGDWGTQFGMLCLAWKTILNKDALFADPIGELERIYKAQNERCKSDPAQLDAARAELVKLQSGDEENLGIWREMIRLSQVQFDTIYSRLGIRFDVTLGESFYNPWLKETVSDLVAKWIARESDGALCVFSDGTVPEKEDPFLIKDENGWKDSPALVQKADGASNYTTTDLATIAYRVREFAPDEIIYVTDGRQQLHFRQFFSVWRRWQPASAVKLAHVWFGSILGEDGKPFKTRSGDTVKLADLLDEAVERASKVIAEKNPEMPEAERSEIAKIIGLGAVKYADLLPNRQGDYVFSWEKMLSFQGNTAPYLQNAYVRIRAIFRKAGNSPVTSHQSPVTFTESAEFALVKKLAHFGEVLPSILDDYRPNLLCNYLFELANAYHSFYEACPVLKADEPARSSRLALSDTTARVLAKGLDLLGIGVPERM
jgi:arginyl-tRNA synthetase